jgi:hypothetical protein
MSFVGKIAFGIILLIQLFLNQVLANFTQDSIQIVQLIQKGKFREAEKTIEKRLKLAKHIPEQIFLNQSLGDIKKLEGDLDEAFRYWRTSNKLRKDIFDTGDYHLAWNYALMSNYFYDKIEPKLAVAYADSCERLIRNLNRNQQKEIQIYKIWNILGQSYKLGITGIDRTDRLKKYEVVRAYYHKSLDFIRSEKLPSFYEAKTLHLLGNSYVDNIYDFVREQNSHEELLSLKVKAETYYSNADEVWRKNSDNYSHERAKTLYVHALMLSILPKEFFPKALDQSILLFKEAELAFGLNKELTSIPNKQDALQCLWLHKGALYEKIRRTKKVSEIKELERLNQTSISLWKTIYKSFKTKNLNQILSIYSLVPYQDVITIENLKKKFNMQWSKEKIFEANQMLKYYDLNRFSHSATKSKLTTLNELQQRLKKNECFIDFISDHLFLFITKDKSEFIELDVHYYKKLDSLTTTILDQNYTGFCALSRGIYKDLTLEKNLHGITSIHVSPAQNWNTLPFEALLQSDKGLASKKYSKLDYLIRSKEISYYFSASYLFEKPKKIDFTGTALAPRSLSSSQLPFSEKLALQLHKEYNFQWIESKSVDKWQLIGSKGDILHFSGHGIIDAENPTLSKLDFGNGFLTLEEVYQFDKVPTFIVLNACNSQNGKTNVGDGVNGFARAFHAVGAQASISNLWEVDDHASNELLNRFYAGLTSGEGMKSSFRKAQLEFIEESNGFEAPYYWAGHRVVGDVKILPLTKTPKTKFFIWILGVLGLIVAVTILVSTLDKRKLKPKRQ